MDNLNFTPPLTGDILRDKVHSPKEHRQSLIENFISEKTVIMIYGDPEAGKSIATLCALCQAAGGLPVFGFFKCVRPLKIYYLLGERGYEEPLERMLQLEKRFPINWDNIYLDSDFVGQNVLDTNVESAIYSKINQYCNNPDIIVFDPIYPFVPGGLSDPKDATKFAQFSARLQNRFQCVIWLNNHTVKNTYVIIEGKRHEKSDPYLGSILLKAHVTNMYYMTRRDDLSKFKNSKDSHQISLKEFTLKYDDESQSLEFEGSAEIKKGRSEKAQEFIQQHKTNSARFTYNEFYSFLHPCSPSYTKKLIKGLISSGSIINTAEKFKPALYEIL